MENTFEYIDLGLPSGTLWATQNAEVDGKRFFSFQEAINIFGADHLPSRNNFDELAYYCNWKWNKRKKGYLIKSKNGNSIFLPADGPRLPGLCGYYWTSTPIFEDTAHHMHFRPGLINPDGERDKRITMSIRLVKNKMQD